MVEPLTKETGNLVLLATATIGGFLGIELAKYLLKMDGNKTMENRIVCCNMMGFAGAGFGYSIGVFANMCPVVLPLSILPTLMALF